MAAIFNFTMAAITGRECWGYFFLAPHG